MTGFLFRLSGKSINQWWIEPLLACRALLFLGRKFQCPCCGWRLRAFTHGGISLRIRKRGYCPRCNSKARHRRDWLFLKEHTGLFVDPLRLLHVAPKYALSRRFVKFPNIRYTAIDLEARPNVTRIASLTDLPQAECTFDALICIHVLEHIENDRLAMAEMFRVLKPGGWALISVPIRLDQKTWEDPAIIDPVARKKAFGEEQHVRIYGRDLVERLETAGFTVTLHPGDELESEVMQKYGLLDNENIFLCRKAK